MNMMNSIKIDLDALKLLNLNINHILTLIKIHFISQKQFLDYNLDKKDLKFLKNNKYIIVYIDKNIQYYIRTKGAIVLDKIVQYENNNLIISDKIEINTDFDNHLKEFRNKFNGLRLGSMGALTATKAKLKRWMKENPKVSFKEILEAVDLYLDSLNGNFNYLQRADYFIYKQNSNKEETSRLSIFIEESTKEIMNSDWGSEIT